MKILSFILFFLIPLTFLMSASDSVSIFISLALNTLLVVFFLEMDRGGNSIKYFLISSISSILLMFGLSYDEKSLVLMALLVKSGFPPFHWWWLSLFKTFSSRKAFIMVFIQKTLFAILAMRVFNFDFMIYLLFCFMLFGTMALYSESLKLFLLLSSYTQFGWILSFGESTWFLVFLSTYFLFSIGLIFSIEKGVGVFWFILILLVLSGFPPFPLFFGKSFVFSGASMWSLIFVYLNIYIVFTYLKFILSKTWL